VFQIIILTVYCLNELVIEHCASIEGDVFTTTGCINALPPAAVLALFKTS